MRDPKETGSTTGITVGQRFDSVNDFVYFPSSRFLPTEDNLVSIQHDATQANLAISNNTESTLSSSSNGTASTLFFPMYLAFRADLPYRGGEILYAAQFQSEAGQCPSSMAIQGSTGYTNSLVQFNECFPAGTGSETEYVLSDPHQRDTFRDITKTFWIPRSNGQGGTILYNLGDLMSGYQTCLGPNARTVKCSLNDPGLLWSMNDTGMRVESEKDGLVDDGEVDTLLMDDELTNDDLDASWMDEEMMDENGALDSPLMDDPESDGVDAVLKGV